VKSVTLNVRHLLCRHQSFHS
jgi:hypothetical protein